MRRLLIQFARYGPYHYARLRSAHEALSSLGWEVFGLETASSDATYAWDQNKSVNNAPRMITAFPGSVLEDLTGEDYRRVYVPLLRSLNPNAIAIAGWGSTDALSCLSWCREFKARPIVMSETREVDGRRIWLRELLKSRVVRRFESGLVGGRSHRDYLVKLGIPRSRIETGYNVVDNTYFVTESAKWNQHKPESSTGTMESRAASSRPYFLASNRFIERKNLHRLLSAYARYAIPNGEPETRNQERAHAPWPLVLLGDGELKPNLIAHAKNLGLAVNNCAPWERVLNNERRPMNDEPSPTPTVFLPGFRQIDELPRFYACAGCFVHPALEEPWGLVINEAMACGLPVLSGNNVGAAEELVDDGINGWKFNATNVEVMAELMGRISSADFPLVGFGEASRRILTERAPTNAFGNGLASLLQQ